MKLQARFAIPLILFLILVIFSGIALYGTITGKRSAQQLPSVLIDKPAPSEGIAKLDQAGEKLYIADYRGEYILVNFFASWCLPCRAEIPILGKLADRVTIVGIAYKDKPEDTRRFLKQYGNPYTDIGYDPEGRYGLSWGVYGIPETYLINAQSQVLWRHAGLVDKTIVEQSILPLLESR